MKERPILFSGPMVRAIIAGIKTQTRRVVNHLGVFCDTEMEMPSPDFAAEYGAWIWHDGTTSLSPYGVVGDRLWVRESFVPELTGYEPGTRACGRYVADDVEFFAPTDERKYRLSCRNLGKRSPSIHMPRWASRLTLEITGVRVERVNSISNADVLAEGVERRAIDKFRVYFDARDVHALAYAELWDSINGKKHPWSSNPWVWVVEFCRVEAACEGK